jgi:hypothetical protein
LEAWLRKQPREVSVAFAARAALRVLPVVQLEKRETYIRDLVLPVFRATAVSWAAAKYPAREKELATACRAAAGALAAQSTGSTWKSGYAAAASRAADYAAVATIRDRASADAADAAADAAYAATYAVQRHAGATAASKNYAARTFWSAVSIDATSLEEGAAPSAIAVSALWPKGQPDQLRSLWQEMKAALHAAEQDWQVWTIWYDDRLAGRVSDEERDLAYVRIEQALWDQGPAIVNAEIKRRIAELEPPTPPLESIPEQEPVATRFGVNSRGLIDVVRDPPAHGAAADPLQREFYEETRLKAQALVELGCNLLGALSDPANRFRAGLKDRIEDVSITSSWSHGNTLRIRLKAHDLSTSNEEPDPGRLHPLVAETLRDVVHTWNIFIVGDPKGRELDEIRLGPQEVDTAKRVVAAAAPIVKALQQSENVATPTAIEAVAEQA